MNGAIVYHNLSLLLVCMADLIRACFVGVGCGWLVFMMKVVKFH